MKVNVYTRKDKVQHIELELEVSEYFVLLRALSNLASDLDANVEDRLLAVMMTENMNEKEQIELDEFNQVTPMMNVYGLTKDGIIEQFVMVMPPEAYFVIQSALIEYENSSNAKLLDQLRAIVMSEDCYKKKLIEMDDDETEFILK